MSSLSSSVVLYLLFGWIVGTSCASRNDAGNSRMQITAITSHGIDNNARFECWQISTPFSRYPTAGGSTFNMTDTSSNVSFVNLPPRSEEGLHNARHSMLFVLLSGLCHVWLLDESEDYWMKGGFNTFLIADDVDGPGHFTAYPSDQETLVLQIPFVDGKLPEHEVLHYGACNKVHKDEDKLAEADKVDSLTRNIWFKEQELLHPFLV